MNSQEIAANISVLLTPFMPYLGIAGEAAIKKIGEHIGGEVWEKVKEIWALISKAAESDPKLKGACITLAEFPDDEDFRISFVKLLSKHLESEPQLSTVLSGIIEKEKIIQLIILEQKSNIDKIVQKMSIGGKQEVIVRNSNVGSITQQQ